MTKVDLSVKIGSLALSSPIIPASGVWPYEDDFWRGEKLAGLGAVCTKAISLRPREGNSGTRLMETPAGLLNSIGLQNAGVDGFIEKYKDMAAAGGLPVIANVVMERPEETAETLKRLADAGVAAAELNISCPNVDGDGMAWGMEPCGAARAIKAVRAAWQGRLWVKLTPQAADAAGVAKAAAAEGADALVVANTWLGMVMDPFSGRPAFARAVAGLSGPAVFPLALRLVWQVCGAVDIPVIGCGGVTTAWDCAQMILAGAAAVEAGTVFFRDVHAGRTICAGLPSIVERLGYKSLAEMKGKAR